MVMTPIMSADDERFMAFEGLVQWAHDVVEQGRHISDALAHQRATPVLPDVAQRRKSIYALHATCHHFVIAAYKLLEHRDWAAAQHLCADFDFSEIDQFSKADIRDLRNMREHQMEYFQGKGRSPGRWLVETPEYRADASSLVGSMIGGRLDWVEFAAATERLVPVLLALPIPFPVHTPSAI
jgi:hypothetical protein